LCPIPKAKPTPSLRPDGRWQFGTRAVLAETALLAAWLLGWAIRGRHYGSARKIENPWIRIPLQLLLVGLALAISLRGWWVITWWP